MYKHNSKELNPMNNLCYRKLKICYFVATLVCICTSISASAEPFNLSTASIEDINKAFDSGALTSQELTKLYLARIEAYDKTGPALHSIITLNPHALETAKRLDQERKATGRRSPLHGIPIVLKDNIDTADMPTTVGSFLFRDVRPSKDAVVTSKLRKAGAIILAKVNMAELYTGVSRSSLGGVMKNPHNLSLSPGVSSGGTGNAMAAVFASAGLGSDTAGSVRFPSAANGIVGLKTTHGLLSLDGITPLAPSLDTVGPMGRNIKDIAIVLGVMSDHNYEINLSSSSLKGARVGVIKELFTQDRQVDWVGQAALGKMQEAGATLVDVSLPGWIMTLDWLNTIRMYEFEPSMAQYFSERKIDGFTTLQDVVDQSTKLMTYIDGKSIPNPDVWGKTRNYLNNGSISKFQYQAIRTHAVPLLREIIEGILRENDVDALVFPTLPCLQWLKGFESGDLNSCKTLFPIASLTGFPELTQVIGFAGGGEPVTLSFLGPANSEQVLLNMGYSLEHRQHAYRLPKLTPALSGEVFEYESR